MEKVLIIEDDKDNLFVLAYCIEKLLVEVIARPQIVPICEIIRIMPGLIMLDHWVNKENGSDLCLEIKNDPRTSHIPVVLISAVINLEEIAKESCADDYINKPYDLEDVEYVVKKYLNLKPA
ncbi:MAG TPA: response regulator [Mucilaginibacter sp.]|nr:response regulator [Mucilaginibacter sp.]